MNTRRHYARVYRKNTHLKIQIAQIIQQKIRYDQIKQAKDRTKDSFCESIFGINTIFERED